MLPAARTCRHSSGNLAASVSQPHELYAVTPNPSLKLTRYGSRRKAGPRHIVHHRVPALRRLPPRAP
jgi:hypothetical protein